MADNYPTLTDEELQQEEWRPIVGYDGVYEVSSMGRVRRAIANFCIPAGRFLKPMTERAGYYKVVLSRNGHHKYYFIHRLVAAAFINPDNERQCVNHKDGDKLNNHLTNLEFVTHKENSQHASRLGLMAFGQRNGAYTKPHMVRKGELNGAHKLKAAQVLEIKRRLATGERGPRLAKEFGVGTSTIHRIKHQLNWRCLA